MVETDIVLVFVVMLVSVIVGNGIVVPCNGIDEEIKRGV